MKKWGRRGTMLEYLKGRGEVSVDELAELFQTSSSTIRRDLSILEKEEMVVRSHGGVVITEGFTTLMKLFDERMHECAKEKSAIALEVCKRIPEGSSVFLDNGSTCYQVAALLSRRSGMRICTNSVKIAQMLGRAEKCDVMLAGGDYRDRNYDCIGQKTVDYIGQIHMDFAVLSADLIVPGRGFFKYSCHSADIAAAMKASASKVFVAADHTKMDTPANFLATGPAGVDILFTDTGISEEHLALLEKELYKIVLCPV